MTKPTSAELREDAEWLISPKNLANSKYSERARRVASALLDRLSTTADREITKRMSERLP